MKKIELFVPLKFNKSRIDRKYLNDYFCHEAQYVSKGRYAIIHILKAHKLHTGCIAISSYMCPSVKYTLEKYGYSVVYYDINLSDLNANTESLRTIVRESKPVAIVVASMYGNPADLFTIEKYCEEEKILLIDDAAQSYGASIDGRNVGSFGDGGFYSFSPGKQTSAHRGGFFWTEVPCCINRTRHPIYAKFMYYNFKYNRYYAYKHRPVEKFFWDMVIRLMSRLKIEIINDDMEPFEEMILGGVLSANDSWMEYRRKWHSKFSSMGLTKDCRIIKCERGTPNYCKIVFVFNDNEERESFAKYLNTNSIAFYGGYNIPKEAEKLPNVMSIQDKIIELPIDSDENRMKYMYDSIASYMSVVN